MIGRIARLGAAFIALIAVGGAWSAVVFAAEETDLRLELVGLQANSKRVVELKVTNVSDWWAQPTTVRVETVKPAAGNVQDAIVVEELDPKQSRIITYTLAADCDGHEIMAVVLPAKNYADVPESNLANNRFDAPKPVCPNLTGLPKDGEIVSKVPGVDPGNISAPLDRGIESKPIGLQPGDVTLPEPLQKGPHTYSLAASDDDVATAWMVGGDSDCTGDTRKGLVGWAQDDYAPGTLFSSSCWWFSQTIVNFDLSSLEILSQEILSRTEIVLKYNETPVEWRDSDGKAVVYGGCVEQLALAPVRWGGRNPNGLFQSEKVLGHTPGVQEWHVTSYVRDMLTGARPRNGFVLHGGNEKPEGHDNKSCLSLLDSIQLVVTYDVP